MELSSLIELFLGSEVERFLSNRKELNVGDELQGKVIELKDHGKILIDFIKFRTIANVKFPVKVGDKINVVLVEKNDNLKFSLQKSNNFITVDSKEIINNIKAQKSGDIVKLIETLSSFVDKDDHIPEEVKNNKIEVLPKNTNKIVETTKHVDGNSIQKSVKNNIPSSINSIKDNVALKSEANKYELKYESIKKQDVTVGDETKLPEQIKGIIKTLQTQFKPFGPAEDILKIIGRLKVQIENSGIFFEKNIESILKKITATSQTLENVSKEAIGKEIDLVIKNDLKPNLLLLKEFFAEDSELMTKKKLKQINTMKTTIDELLHNIGKQQEGAVKRNTNIDTMQYFTFQIPLKDKKKAKLRVYYNKKDKKEIRKRGFNLSLLLVMNNLGEIRTDFFLLNKDLNITFYVSDEGVKITISNNLVVIKDMLRDLFRFLNINVIVSKKKIRDFENEDLSNENIKLGLVDLRA